MGASDRRDATGASTREPRGVTPRQRTAMRDLSRGQHGRQAGQRAVCPSGIGSRGSDGCARRLKAEGLTPEQMPVLVKAAMSIHGLLEFGAQALTSDIVRWSIDAYLDD